MSRTIDPFDELAAMFLSSPAPAQPLQAAPPRTIAPQRSQTSRVPKAAPRPAIDVLVVGHLPVRAGLWLTPYADAVARDHGCVALVRLDGSEPSLQILRGPAEFTSSPQPVTLQHGIAELGGSVNAWIVRPAPGGAADSTELVASGSPQVTILSSGDEAAVVAAYQVIKNLSQAAQETDSPVPAVQLAVMGCDQVAAEAVVERLNRTTVSFLGVEVRLANSLPRMDASIRSTRYMSFAHEPMPALADVLAWLKDAEQASLRRPVQSPGVIGRVGGEEHSTESRADSAPRRATLRIEDPQPSPRAGNGIHREVQPAAGDVPMRLRPKPAMDVEAKDTAQPREPDDHGRPIPLATHVEGLTPLIVRMPGHEHVELAVDRAGRLHVLCNEPVLRDLHVVQSWAHAHREIIAMACPQSFIDQSATVIGHVFTDRPAALADLHGTDLHLHVRAPVVVNGQTGWYAAPLNSPK